MLDQIWLRWNNFTWQQVMITTPISASLLNDHFKSGKPDFDVLICGNDRAAFVAYQVLLAKGVRIPQDVAVMGFDNLVGVGHLFLPPRPQFSFHMTLSGGKLHCILLKVVKGEE